MPRACKQGRAPSCSRTPRASVARVPRARPGPGKSTHVPHSPFTQYMRRWLVRQRPMTLWTRNRQSASNPALVQDAKERNGSFSKGEVSTSTVTAAQLTDVRPRRPPALVRSPSIQPQHPRVEGGTKVRDNKPPRAKNEAPAPGRAAHTNEDVVDRDMEEPHKVSDEAHHCKSNRRGRRNLGKLCGRRDEMARAREQRHSGTRGRFHHPQIQRRGPRNTRRVQDKPDNSKRGKTHNEWLETWATGTHRPRGRRRTPAQIPTPAPETRAGRATSGRE